MANTMNIFYWLKQLIRPRKYPIIAKLVQGRGPECTAQREQIRGQKGKSCWSWFTTSPGALCFHPVLI